MTPLKTSLSTLWGLWRGESSVHVRHMCDCASVIVIYEQKQSLIRAYQMDYAQPESQCVCVCVCVCVCPVPLALPLFRLQVRHWGFFTGCPGTCSTSLQYISGPVSPHVALVLISAMEARFSTAGKRPAHTHTHTHTHTPLAVTKTDDRFYRWFSTQQQVFT